jgi:ATP-binding cassette subfamily B protein
VTGPAQAGSTGWVRRLWGHRLRHKADVVLSIVCAVLGSSCQTIVPLLEREIVDTVIVTHTIRTRPSGPGTA